MFRTKALSRQFLMVGGVVAGVALLCFLGINYVGYKSAALILLMTVSLLAIFFDILPVLFAAALSALIWNYFFIPPIYTFHIGNAEDLLLFLMYFAIALINAVLTFKIRDREQKIRDKEEKEKSIKLYNTLLNSLSHELRTPIATIIGSVDALRSGDKSISQNDKEELLNQLESAALRLNRQVENLLNMSRLESGMLKVRTDWCDINEIIFSVVHKFQGVNTHKIQFTTNDSLPLIKVDHGLIEQILQNLISNAILHTREGTIVNISCQLNENKLDIIVADNGEGMSDSELESIFDKFYRSPEAKSGGTGLGLSIVKGLTEAHGGMVSAKSEKQKGSEFKVSLNVETSYLNRLNNE